MRCQGKMICRAVRWCTLYFTVHFGVTLSHVVRKGSAWGEEGEEGALSFVHPKTLLA